MGRRRKAEVHFFHAFGYDDGLNFIQLFYPALYLGGFGGLVAEAADKIFQFGYFFLLGFPFGKEGFQLGAAALFVLAVIAGVSAKFAVQQFVHFVDAGVQKRAVVRDNDKAAAVVLQKVFQPAARFQVQIVGRLVQQHDVRACQYYFGQADAHLPAAGKGFYRAVQVGRIKAQPLQHFADAVFAAVVAGVVYTFVNMVKLLKQQHGALVVGFALFQFAADIFALLNQLFDGTVGFFGLLVDAAAAVIHARLRQPGYAGVFLYGTVAGVGRQVAGNDAQQGGFPGAVWSGQGGLGAGGQVECGVLQDITGAESQADTGKLYKSHAVSTA